MANVNQHISSGPSSAKCIRFVAAKVVTVGVMNNLLVDNRIKEFAGDTKNGRWANIATLDVRARSAANLWSSGVLEVLP